LYTNFLTDWPWLSLLIEEVDEAEEDVDFVNDKGECNALTTDEYI